MNCVDFFFFFEQSPVQLTKGHTLSQRKCLEDSTFISFRSANTENYNQLCTPSAPRLPVLSVVLSPDPNPVYVELPVVTLH